MAGSVVITHRDIAAPTNKAKAFNHPDWIWELKHDGYRALLIKDGSRTSMLTRKGNDLIGQFPEIAADMLKLPDMMIDGELVMLNRDGKPEFHELRGRCAIRDPEAASLRRSDQSGDGYLPLICCNCEARTSESYPC